jgi:hypothetical protein
MAAKLHGGADKVSSGRRVQARAATRYPHSGIHPQVHRREAARRRLTGHGANGRPNRRVVAVGGLAGCRSCQVMSRVWGVAAGGGSGVGALTGVGVPCAVGVPSAHADVCDLTSVVGHLASFGLL